MNTKKICIVSFLFYALAVSAFSQQRPVSLDAGLENGVKYFEGRLPTETKLAVLNISSTSRVLSEYIIEELTAVLANSTFTVVERSDLEILDQELNFQQSAEINDRTAASIGEKWGAQTIILGSIILRDNDFRLRIRAIAVENATIQGIFTADIARDRYLLGLYNTNQNGAASGTAQPSGGSSSGSNSSSRGSSGTGGRIRLPDYLKNN
jgi:uncharacterized membrane protein YgcG